MAENEKSSWEKEFAEFLAIESVQVPNPVSERVLAEIRHRLHPSALRVFGKVLFIQFVVGLLSLLFCPQFGISLTSNLGIMPYLMMYGESICMLGCGALFTAFSLSAASFALKPEEVLALKKHEVLHLISLSTLSLGAFLCVGGEVVFTLGLVWLIGAVIGGAVTFEAGWALRQSLARRAV